MTEIEDNTERSARSHPLSDSLRLPELKRLLFRISSTQRDEGFKSLIILSELAGEGRSLVTTVLALAYASILKKRVLILDTVSQSKEESYHYDTILREHTGPVPNGPPSPVFRGSGIDLLVASSLAPHHLSSPDSLTSSPGDLQLQALQTAEFMISPFLRALSPSYDLILIDTCALQGVSSDNFDPLVLARQVDRALFIISPLSDNRPTLEKIRLRLQQAQIPVLGSIHNSSLPPHRQKSQRGGR